MARDPSPPCLMIRDNQAFWIHRDDPRLALATRQAFEDGCFENAWCYDASGGLWPIVGAKEEQPPSRSGRVLPWQKLRVSLALGPRTESALSDIIARLARILRPDNEFVEFSRTSAAEIASRLRLARSPEEVIQIAIAFAERA